ncbi:MAG: GTP-binding protein, partial [Firmicutes bacterium]|nr:GTP-binding protein [Bacillota bacterium]
MTKVDIFSGFLGAGKTTLIKKLIDEAYKGEKVVLIENEFGEIGIDSGFLKDAGVTINEMNSGCICCSLVGDFGIALNQVIQEFNPDRILIEPSGVGKLSDVILAVEDLHNEAIQLNGFTTVVDAKKCKMYMKNFGEFFNNQIENASAIVLSHTKGLSQEKMDQCVALLREHNQDAEIITTDWDSLTGMQILETMEKKNGIAAELARLAREMEEEHHHHHDHDHDHDHEHCDHHHDHDHDHEHCDHHHDHDHDHEHCDHHHDHEHCDHHHDHDHDHEHCDHHHDHEHCDHHHDHDHDHEH